MNFIEKINSEILDWIETFLSLLPGNFGVLIRKLWYSIRFDGNNTKVFISLGCKFETPGSMTFYRNISIGRNSFFSSNGGTIIIGNNAAFNSNVHINSSVGGKILIGDNVLVGPNVVMRTANHRFDNPALPINMQGHSFEDIIIENNVWIAANVVVLGGVKIGTGSIIAAGSVVTKDIPANVIAGGIPAMILKKRYE
jgi:galactoside O-acetyltransferase